MDELLKLYQETLTSGIDYTISYGLTDRVKDELLDNLFEVGYAIREVKKSDFTQETIDKDKFIYFQIDTSLYLRLKNEEKAEPLFLDTEYGTHYLMEEGTNSIIICMHYSEMANMLNISDGVSPKEAETIFNNSMVKCVEEIKKKHLKIHDYGIKYQDYFLKNTESQKFNTLIYNLPIKIKEYVPELQKELSIDILKYIKSNNPESLDFKVDITGSRFFYDKETTTATVEISLSISNIVDNVFKRINILNKELELGKYTFSYEFSKDELDKIKSIVEKTFNDTFASKAHRKNTATITKDSSELTATIYYITPQIKKKTNIIGDEKEFELLVKNIVDFCKQGTFLKNPNESKIFKQFFTFKKPTNGVFKIVYNEKLPTKRIELSLGSNGVAITSVGDSVKEYLDKKNISLDKCQYIKGDSDSLSLDGFITLINGLAPRVIWTGILGFYDGRTTFASATKKSEKLVSGGGNPKVESIRSKYSLPKEVTILPDKEIVGVFHGIPELKGSSDKMILMFGINGGNPIFIAKQDVIDNKEEFIKHGFKD